MSEFIYPFFIFVFGAIIGSFLNVCIYRLPREESIVFPPSSCPECKTKLKFYENIPLVSYLVLRGRCAHCGKKIDFRYFLVEFLTAVSALVLFLHFKTHYVFLYYFLFTCLLIVVFFIDFEHKLILDEVTYPFTFAAIAGSLFLPKALMSAAQTVFIWSVKNAMMCNLLNSIAGAVLGVLFFYFIRFFGSILAKQEAMGLGDVKFAMLIGAFLGWQKALVAFFIAFFIGAFAAVFLIIFFKKRGKDEIPFGTFMALGAGIAIFYADAIIKFYSYIIF